MSPKYESVHNDAMKLPPKKREMLAEQLEISVLGLSEEERIHAWAKLADKRYRDYNERKAVVLEVNDVIEEARIRTKR